MPTTALKAGQNMGSDARLKIVARRGPGSRNGWIYRLNRPNRFLTLADSTCAAVLARDIVWAKNLLELAQGAGQHDPNRAIRFSQAGGDILRR